MFASASDQWRSLLLLCRCDEHARSPPLQLQLYTRGSPGRSLPPRGDIWKYLHPCPQWLCCLLCWKGSALFTSTLVVMTAAVFRIAFLSLISERYLILPMTTNTFECGVASQGQYFRDTDYTAFPAFYCVISVSRLRSTMMYMSRLTLCSRQYVSSETSITTSRQST